MNFNGEQLNHLLYWIKERERIRVNKTWTSDPERWTKDPVMRNWRWCNVNRCHDRETRWIFKNIIEQHKDSSTLWFNLCIARFINWSPTLKQLGYFHVWKPKHFCGEIKAIIEADGKAYTGAYMIRAGTGDDAKMPKHEYLVKRVFTPLWESRLDIPQRGEYRVTCEQWSNHLSQIFGMGDFMRNQIITDMKYSPILPIDKTVDWKTFCLAGPGTRRGLNRLTDQPLTKSWKEIDSMKALMQLRRNHGIQQLPFAEYFDDLNNLANCLCEFDKYMRLRNKEGEPRAKYKPSPLPLP